MDVLGGDRRRHGGQEHAREKWSGARPHRSSEVEARVPRESSPRDQVEPVKGLRPRRRWIGRGDPGKGDAEKAQQRHWGPVVVAQARGAFTGGQCEGARHQDRTTGGKVGPFTGIGRSGLTLVVMLVVAGRSRGLGGPGPLMPGAHQVGRRQPGQEHQGGEQDARGTGQDHGRKVMALDEPGPGGDTSRTMRHIPVQQSWWPWRGTSRGGPSCA